VQTLYIRNVRNFHRLNKTQVYAVSDDVGSPSSSDDAVPAAEKVKKDKPLVPENEPDLDQFYSVEDLVYIVGEHNNKSIELAAPSADLLHSQRPQYSLGGLWSRESSITSVNANTPTIEVPSPGVDGKTPPGTFQPRPCYNNIYTTLQQCFRYGPRLRRGK
jgi:hypothetical protein